MALQSVLGEVLRTTPSLAPYITILGPVSITKQFDFTSPSMKLGFLLLATSAIASRNSQIMHVCSSISQESSQTQKRFTIQYPNLMNFCRQHQRKSQIGTSFRPNGPGQTTEQRVLCDSIDFKSWLHSTLCSN